MKKTLVLGASLKPSRYAHMAILRLRAQNHPVVAVGLRSGEVGDVQIETTPVPFENIDTVTLYLGPQNQPPNYEYIVSLQPRRVVFNPGTENPELYALLREHSIEVEVACTLVLLATNQY